MRLISNLLNHLVNCSKVYVNLPQNCVKLLARDFSQNRQLNKSNSSWGSNKKHRNIKIQSQLIAEMADPIIEEKLAPLRAAVKEQVICKLQFV